MNRRSLLKRCLLAPMAAWFGFSVEPEQVGRIEDVRVYGHALGGKDIKRLSKGLCGVWVLNENEQMVSHWQAEETITGRYVYCESGCRKGELVGYTFTDQPPSRSGRGKPDIFEQTYEVVE